MTLKLQQEMTESLYIMKFPDSRRKCNALSGIKMARYLIQMRTNMLGEVFMTVALQSGYLLKKTKENTPA